MADVFDQIHAAQSAPPPTGGDVFSQIHAEAMGAPPGVPRPANPIMSAQTEYLIGGQGPDSLAQSVANVGGGMVRGMIEQGPGAVVRSVANIPTVRKYVPGASQVAPPSPDLPGQIVISALPEMFGAEGLPRTSPETAPRPVPAEAPTGGMLSDALAAARKIPFAEHIPYLGNAIRLGDALQRGADMLRGGQEPPPAPTPAPQPTFQPGPPEMWGRTVEPVTAAPTAPPTSGPSTVPRVLSGEGVLNEALTGLDNKSLLKVARSRGINVTAEAQLKPGVADNRIIGKIIDDFSPDELAEARNIGLEMNRFGPAPTGIADPKLAAEAWHNRVLQTFFPDVSIPQASINRVRAATAAQPGGGQDMTAILQQSIKAARAKRGMVPLSSLVR